MYLFLVDYNFISSEQLQKMIGQIIPEADIVNCFSTDTLLKITEKLKPDVIIIDFDIVSENQKDLVKDLRSISKDAHILALIDPDYYEKLYEAIEFNAVDDYMVKPIRNEDFMARIYIATRRKGLAVEDYYNPHLINRDSSGMAFNHWDSEEKDEDTLDKEISVTKEISNLGTTKFASKSTEDNDDGNINDNETEEMFDFEDKGDSPYADINEKDDFFGSPDEKLEEAEEISEIEEIEEVEEVVEEVEEVEGEVDKDSDSILFSDKIYEAESTNEEDLQKKSIYTDADEDNEDLENKTENDDLIESESDLFDEPLFSEQTETVEVREGSFTDLFKETGTESTEGEATNLKGIGESSAKEIPDDWDFKDDIFEIEQDFAEQKAESQPKTDSTKEEAEDNITEVNEYENNIFNDEAAEAAEEEKVFQDSYFDDLFSDEHVSDNKERKKGSSAFIREDDVNSSYTAERSSNNIVKPHSDLPGESADLFLYGESAINKEENKNKDKEEFESELFTGEFQGESQLPNRVEKKKKTNTIFSTFGNILFVFILLMMAVLSFFLIQSRISGGVPKVAGYQMYIVLSGSMSPEFDTGSLAFVRETAPEEIVVGDIITFRSQAGSDSLTTHRVVEVIRDDGLKFVTRGDANNVNDPNPVPTENIVGRVTGSVPYIGYLLNFVQTRQGLILLIFVPGVLIILFELGKIMTYLREGDSGGKKKKDKKYSYPAEDL